MQMRLLKTTMPTNKNEHFLHSFKSRITLTTQLSAFSLVRPQVLLFFFFLDFIYLSIYLVPARHTVR